MRCLGRGTLVISNYDQLCRVPNRGQGAGATRPASTLGRSRVAPATAGHGRCYDAHSRHSASLAQLRIEAVWLRMRPWISNLKQWEVRIWATSGMKGGRCRIKPTTEADHSQPPGHTQRA